MDVYEAIFSRRTIRDFQAKAINEDIVKKIIDAGLHAPSNDHMREWQFVVIQDQSVRVKVIDRIQKHYTKEEVEAWLDSWNSTDPVQRSMYIDGVPKQHRMLLSAGCLILPFFRQPRPLLKPENLSSLNAFASIWCCIENMLIAAVSEGIYGVTRIPFDKEIKYIKEVVNCPADYEIPCFLALGYPGDNASKIKQHSVKAEDRIHWNCW